jgi:hypothetical protein
VGEIIHLSRERIVITVYTRGNRFGTPDPNRLVESELTLALVHGVVKELGQWYFEVRARSWTTHFFEALLRGAHSTPAVIIGRKVVSQGSVPDRNMLRRYLREQVHIIRPRLAKSS